MQSVNPKTNKARNSIFGLKVVDLLALCCLSAPLLANSEEPRNALLIQADFAGLVMTGVAYTVSQDLEPCL